MDKIMYNKIALAGFFVTGVLFGMNKGSGEWLVPNATGTHYAHVGKTCLYEGAHIRMKAYLLYVRESKEHKIKQQFTFDNEIGLVFFRDNTLSVTLIDGKTYQFYYP